MRTSPPADHWATLKAPLAVRPPTFAAPPLNDDPMWRGFRVQTGQTSNMASLPSGRPNGIVRQAPVYHRFGATFKRPAILGHRLLQTGDCRLICAPCVDDRRIGEGGAPAG